MTFSRKILLGLAAGVATGLLLGDLVRPLSFVADGFVKLLQMTVLPYVTLSIVSSLGALSLADARTLGLRVGAVLLAVWVVALAGAFLLPLSFPTTESASFFSTTLVERRVPFDFVSLYIPANPFNALANNVVPAVVLFSVLVGVALIGVERKQPLLDVLETALAALARGTRLIAQLTPYGLFAIAAVTAGTLTFERLQRIQIFLLAYIAVSLVLALWVLPGLVAALTGIRLRDIFGRTRDPLIVAFVAGDLFIVLPGLIDACKALLAERAAERAAGLPDVIVPVSFNFPHAGKLLSLAFIPFAAWFSDAPLELADYPSLAVSGVLSFFGSLNSAVPFLLNLFRIPADTFQLFLATGVLNARFGTLLAAMHTVTMALLGSLALAGGLQWRVARLLRFGVVTVLMLGATIGGMRVAFETVLKPKFAGEALVYGRTLRFGGEPADVQPRFDAPADPAAGDVLSQIRARGVLRVAALPERLPFAFRDRGGRLVGLDVELARQLATELGVEARFFQAELGELPALLEAGTVDIAMSGIPVTPDRTVAMLFSTSYLDETLAFVMKDHLRDSFANWSAIRGLGRVRVGIPDIPSFRIAVSARAPALELVPLRELGQLFREDGGLMAYVLPAERGSVMTLLHPAYSVVVPTPDVIKIPLAFPLGRRDQRWATFVDTWLELKRRDGTIDALYRHWILGQDEAVATPPRWSILRDVLHWLD